MNPQKKQIKSNIAIRIKEVREAKNLTQFDLANASGLSQAAISQYEAGNIALELLPIIRLCDGLGCTVDYLIGRDVEYGGDSLRGRLFTAFSKMSAEGQGMSVDMMEFLVKDKV